MGSRRGTHARHAAGAPATSESRLIPDPPPPDDLIVVTTTLPTEADARRVAETLVTERLAACAQVQGPVHSVFRWQGAVDHATEWYCHLKTTRARWVSETLQD